MSDVKITVMNYRCFADSNPVTIELGKGFTALVGPNNSGKSCFLRMFYELRRLLGGCHSFGGFSALVRDGWDARADGVFDPQEIFFDGNGRGCQITFDVGAAVRGRSRMAPISRLHLLCGRGQTIWRATTDPQGGPPTNMSEDGTLTYTSGIQLDYQCLFTLFGQLGSSMYIGPFRNAINEGAGSYYDLSIGSSFITTWHQWKTGPSKEQNRAIEKVTEDIRRIFDFKRLEITASLELKTLQILVEGRPYKLCELGSGLSQFIVVFANAAIRKPSFILIDEPELNLHPSLQADFLTSLASYATEGVIFATHSIGLARTIAERIYSVQRLDDRVICRPLGQTPGYAEFIGEMSFSSFKELGFEQLLLVEGVTDVKTVQQFLRMIGKDHEIVVIPLGGDQLAKGGMELELEELRRITSKIAVLVDSERGSEGGPALKARTEFEASCQKLGIKICLTQRKAIENYFSEGAIQEEKGGNYHALGPYQRLKDGPMAWSKAESWRIARRMKWEEVKDTDVGQFLAGL